MAPTPSHRRIQPVAWRISSLVWPWLVLLLALAACTPSTPTATLTLTLTPTSAPTALPTATPPPATPAPAVQNVTADAADLPQEFADALGITLEPESSRWTGVEVLEIGPDLWAAFTTGFRSFEPPQNHAIALFTQEDGFWIELDRVELECSDYVDKHSVRQVELDSVSLWLGVYSGAGAHSGCFDLLRWDGSNLTVAVDGFNSSPGVGEVRDVDGDGQAEVVLNATDPYVFCYACGVRLYNISILRWNGAQLLPVELTRLPDDTVADLRDANNRAVELAEASLFPDALPLIDEALSYAPNDERVYWNHQFIHALAQGRADYAFSTPFPLINWIFYGDWDAALAELNDYAPAQLFDPQMALLEETAAAGWQEALADWILSFSGPALAARPELDSAWFLQGWARFMKDPADLAARADVEEAARLAPDSALYRSSVEQLSSRGVVQPAPTATAGPAVPVPATVETVRFLAGATVHELIADLSGGVTRGYRLGISGGQRLFVTAPAGVRHWLVSSGGQRIPGVADAGATRFAIPFTDNFTLVLQGNGPASLLLAIPPLAAPETPAPARTERVRFAAGATSATLEPVLSRGAAVGYVLGIGAGQRMWVTATSGAVGFWVLDPDGLTLSPITPRTTRGGEFAIPRTGDHTLVLDGEGPVQVVVEIPPR